MYRILLRGICILTLVGLALGIQSPGTVRAESKIVNLLPDFIFGRQITFRADIEPQATVTDASFYFKRPEDNGFINVPAKVDDQGGLVYEYDSMRYPLRAFSQVAYYFEATIAGEVIQSDQAEFTYEDNRFDWQTLESGPFSVHWYEGDEAFGQDLMDVAQKGLAQAQTWLRVADPDRVNIYAYASAQEMRSTNMLAGTNWIAGHADPDLRLIEISIPPGPEQLTEMERQIPHELMHILLYLTVGQAYYNLPTWLNEGLASANEIYPNPYYHTILTQTAAKGGLLPLSDICHNFPVDASGAYLAYAEADSFTRYLYDRFGSDGLETLLVSYSKNPTLDCQDGTTPALGISLTKLESDWRQTALGEKSGSSGADSPWPWVTVLGIVLLVPGVALTAAMLRRSGKGQPTVKARRSA